MNIKIINKLYPRLDHSVFEFVSNFGFRASDLIRLFGIRICFGFRKIFLILILFLICFHQPTFARSTPHHLYNMWRKLDDIILSPFKGIFIKGPQNIKKAYISEVYEKEKPEKVGKLRYKLFGVYRAPGEEIKGIIDGLSDSANALTNFSKEFISIFFGD